MEHAAEAGELPVVTTAEQRVVKATEMERGKLLSDDPLPQVPISCCQKVPQQQVFLVSQQALGGL